MKLLKILVACITRQELGVGLCKIKGHLSADFKNTICNVNAAFLSISYKASSCSQQYYI